MTQIVQQLDTVKIVAQHNVYECYFERMAARICTSLRSRRQRHYIKIRLENFLDNEPVRLQIVNYKDVHDKRFSSQKYHPQPVQTLKQCKASMKD